MNKTERIMVREVDRLDAVLRRREYAAAAEGDAEHRARREERVRRGRRKLDEAIARLRARAQL